MRTVTKRRKRRSDLQKLGDLLPVVLKRNDITLGIEDLEILHIWKQAVGPQIAAQTTLSKFKNKTLFVLVSTPAWMQELQFMKQQIIDKVNSLSNKTMLRNIYFSPGHLPAPPSPEGEETHFTSGSYSLDNREKRLVLTSCRTVPDKDLRSIIERVMTREILIRKAREDE